MTLRKLHTLIPTQISGAERDSVAEKKIADIPAATDYFQKVCARLLQVNQWKKYAGDFTADFQLFDSNGKEADRAVQLHDHFRIDIPGPGSIAGDGYDWVQVERMEKYDSDEEDFLLMTVRPVANPTGNSADTAHFFSDESTSTFIISRLENMVSAEVHGRNEKPNTDVDLLADKARNAIAGTAAIIGFSKIEWQSLADGLLNYSEEI